MSEVNLVHSSKHRSMAAGEVEQEADGVVGESGADDQEGGGPANQQEVP
eukprot:CAMPEP_0197061438 /NCGR_PEP_ID=MMETSP1384-20130603/136638_1 /TAXON_ID=29189 /ORGANISM="Ammonia sp." /LENGTH=48 /DNA_ID= /DNA_START= /DNA_END= /DNA_ORIENTATION=